ncbi:type II toxin-antitoxin system RelE/ParE family toxin [Verrucomicrobium sp. BvORR034]|uniref:type II toxin-antitoxin system RelE/ParE family toxin n=1 Tax=Verrucomicrobium sp. BvORR034 TaxID=1396418 RepID=UPI0006799613|nr:type II toxin-antitoxin system RelE/ParE family toxin [Verrucomicrobium sp. BvORR034]
MAEQYEIIIQPRAEVDLDEIYVWLMEHAPGYAEGWFNAFEARLAQLTTFPERFPLAPENQFGVFDRQVRQLLHGNGFWKYRVLYFVEGTSVQIVHIRHGARRWLGESADE